MILSNLLLYRLLILNACGAAAIVWAWQKGFVAMTFAADSSNICYAIALLFLIGILSVFRRAAKVSKALNDIKSGLSDDINAAKFLAKGDHIADIAQWCAVLGLTGTVVGFIMALYGLDVDGDPKHLIGQLVEGMSVAFFTTLAGGVCGLWLELNNRVLLTATRCMLEDAKDAPQWSTF